MLALAVFLFPNPSLVASAPFTEDLLIPKEVGVATIIWTLFSLSGGSKVATRHHEGTCSPDTSP